MRAAACPCVAGTMQSPGLDVGQSGCIGMHCAAVASASWRRAAFRADAHGHFYPSRRQCDSRLLHDFDGVRLLHRVIPIAMEDDDRYGLLQPSVL